ncbi:zinc finger B-box domain-containing protein 1 isoform X2 [Notolabrus celidotus]|uniref:zinc finger B-box domain-containing protein 1 isoform X2 n=1 Tax=Notolabrus celidotus TaxID=1203425 RepID=UPI0014901168|nr:zinc finger B-box domain-containing protein 1 isoform X2 [Notolabrus celidotus]
MNLNEFVVLPNNKAKSVKLNARNLLDLQMHTATLTQESEEMEEKLQHLKERMSKEKEERGSSAGFRWKSGQCGSSNSTNNTTKSKDNRLQKLSAGKVNIRVLKDEPLTVTPQPPLPIQPPTIGRQTTRKNRRRGKFCGQCEVKTAGVMCAECTEDYCIGCFTKFHQKGALKLHRIIPIQTDLHTHVSTRDVVSCVQKQEARAKPMQLHHGGQVLSANLKKKKEKIMEERPKSDHKKECTDSLLRGEYNEDESARSFQEALRQWRKEKGDVAGKTTSEEAMWMPVRPVSVSATATQTDLAPDRRTEGRGRGEGAVMVPVRVEFTENSLTYMDRLLLKKHRRTPVETSRPLLAFGSDIKSPPNTNTEEETTSSLTVEEEDFRHYFASLFAVPVSKGRTEPQMTTPESCLTIEVLNERDGDKDGDKVGDKDGDKVGAFNPEQRCPFGQQVLNNGDKKVTQTARASSSKNKPSSCPTAATPRTTKESIKTPTSKSQKHYCPPTVHKSKPDRGSQQLLSSLSLPLCQNEIPKSSHFSSPFLCDVSPLASATPPIPEDPLPPPSPSIPFSLRSTFTVSPSSSTESPLLPRLYQLTTLQNGSVSSLLPEQSQSSQLFPQPISSVRLSQSPQSNLQPQRQSQHSLYDPEILFSLNELQLTPSPVPPSPNLAPRPLEASPASRACAYSSHRSTPTNEDTPVLMNLTPVSSDHDSTISQKDVQCIHSLSSHHIDVMQHSSIAVKMEEEEELSIDSGDEMSSDSLGLAPHEEDTSDEESEELHMHGHLMRGRCREGEQRNPAISHPDDPLVDAEKEEQLSEPWMKTIPTCPPSYFLPAHLQCLALLWLAC